MHDFDPRAFKAYDVRGTYPDQVNERVAYALGRAYAERFQPRTVVVGHDVRRTSPALKQALTEGLLGAGVDVIDIGPISTEMLYFAVGRFGYDGGLAVTASHNPAEYNGFKMVRAGAEPVTWETGIQDLRDMLPRYLADAPAPGAVQGTVRDRDVFPEYREFLLGFIEPSRIRPTRVVANANFGFQGQFARRVVEGLPVEIELLNGEPDGSFPKGQPDPFLAENRAELLATIRRSRPDFGVAWDADADRVFFATRDGVFVEGYYTAALLAQALLAKHPGEKVIYDVRYTWAIIDAVLAAGGTPLVSRVGHSYIKQALRKHHALFCGEASGHVYFRDYFYADTGMLPFLLTLELVSERGRSFGELVAPFMERYVVSGEINSRVEDPAVVLAALRARYEPVAEISELDGLTVECRREWRFNVRSSNTEGLLRLNVEAGSEDRMREMRDEVLGLIRKSSAAAS